MSSRLSVRLSRLLNMIPYFIAHPGISAAEAAADLGVTTKQLMSDLNQLWMCGLPGYGPGDLIDLSFSEESIEVTFSAGIDRPLRLTSTEATALLVALRSIVDMPGMVDPTAANAAIAKIESAISGGAAPAEEGQTRTPPPEAPAVAAVRSALALGRALRLVYYSASRDVVSERLVDPIRIVLVDDNSYLQAWCRQAEGVRLFRFDRIEAATELDEPARPPKHATEATAGLDLFQDDPAVPQAHLRIHADYAWVLDQYPMHRLAVHPDGSLEATMRFATLDWMARLLLGFGAGVTVLGPPELVAAVRERSNAALAAYEEAGYLEAR
ncbi:YafY family transcriptional regulator [Streptomyces gardneri]|uniref:helix-turn-helix transcriptional regulator n=1 Tax=Nocardia TaxID=1817 RepID=UPI00135C8418|nr:MULTISPECIES: YafY family protein [Nocardia]MBF6167253.1 YafY family transcriptional regulator [Streptomyces gardneri]MBF6204297.1 YafY family transcriptional regulator [Streptomyces gardneri]UAK30509.1 YafY family transcriptional regulator [Nocardia asteroides]